MMAVVHELATSGLAGSDQGRLTRMEREAYFRHCYGLPSAERGDQRDALKRAKRKLRALLERAGYCYDDFFLAA